jgi:hypothetical protein
MNKRGIKIFFLAIIFLFLIMPLVNSESYTSDETINVSVRITEFVPLLRVEIIEDSLYLGEVTKWRETLPKPFNITNTGNIDAYIRPEIIADSIFSNLEISKSPGSGYKKIGEFVGKITVDDKEDFWIKLNLKDYSDNFTGYVSTEITFLVMSDEE